MAIRDPELAKARKLIADDRKARTKARNVARAPKPKVKREKAKGRERDKAFLAWLHRDIPCIACEIEQNPTWPTVHPVEAAHQKHAKGRGGMLGMRPDDADSCPLCAWHHRLAPNACDPAQRKFWSALGIDVGAFCRELYQAFKTDRPGADVVAKFVRIAQTCDL